MSTIDEFFNYSKFEVRGLSSNVIDIEPDVQVIVPLEIYDAVGVDEASIVTAKLLSKSGRTSTELPVAVTVGYVNAISFSMIFTIPTADWVDGTELILDIQVTSREAFAYKLQYQVRG